MLTVPAKRRRAKSKIKKLMSGKGNVGWWNGLSYSGAE